MRFNLLLIHWREQLKAIWNETVAHSKWKVFGAKTKVAVMRWKKKNQLNFVGHFFFNGIAMASAQIHARDESR